MPDAPIDLAEALENFAHGNVGIEIIGTALRGLAVPDRVAWLAQSLLTAPLTHEDAQRRVGEAVEAFNVLQGDVVRTAAAYRFGVRIEGDASYLVATSSCDLIFGRRSAALLLPVVPRRRSEFRSDKQFASEIGPLSLFTPKKHFYLPVLPDDDDDVLFNVALLDPLATCTNEAVNLAERRASLSLVGWRMFGTLVRELLVREAQQEPKMRGG